MADILITEFMDTPAVDSLRADYDVHYDPDLHGDTPGIAGRLGCARALIVRNRTRVDAGLLAAGPRLVAVGRLGVGLDNIDLDACAERSVSVFPATGANVAAVAEYVIAATLMMLRGAYRATDRVLAGEWPRTALIGREASGRTHGSRRPSARKRSCCNEHSQLPVLGGVHRHQLCGTARVASARAGDAVVHGA